MVEPAFFQRPLVQRARVGVAGEERFPTEEQDEQLQTVTALGFGECEQVLVVAGKVEQRGKVDLEELFRDGPGALEIEPPARAIGQDAPAKMAGREIVHASQIAKHLGGGRDSLSPASGPAIEGPEPALGLDHRKSKLVTLPLLGEGVGAVLRRIVGEQQSVGNVFPAPGREVLLAQARRPAEPVQDGPDQVVLGLAFVGRVRDREAVEYRSKRSFEVVERRIVEGQPIRRSGNGFGEEITREQATLERFPDIHPRAVLQPDLLLLAGPSRDANGLLVETFHRRMHDVSIVLVEKRSRRRHHPPSATRRKDSEYDARMLPRSRSLRCRCW